MTLGFLHRAKRGAFKEDPKITWREKKFSSKKRQPNGPCYVWGIILPTY